MKNLVFGVNSRTETSELSSCFLGGRRAIFLPHKEKKEIEHLGSSGRHMFEILVSMETD